MKTTLHLAQVNEIMDIMLRFISKHTTLPILENIYIKTSLDSILFRATDMEKYVEISLPVETDEESVITINAKTFSDILKTIDDEYFFLEITSAREEVKISTMNDSFTLKWISAAEYVATPNIQSKTQISINPKLISEWINKVEFAVTEKNFSPIMTGIFIRTKEYHWIKKLVFVWTDSFRLAEYKIAIPTHNEFDQNISMVIPKIHVLDVKKVLDYMVDKWIEECNLEMSDSMILCSAKINDLSIRTMSLLIQGNFPEYENENIIPTSFNCNIYLDKNHCEKAIKKIATITRSINNYIAIQSTWNALNISSGTTDVWEWSTTIEAKIEGNEMQFWLNGKYVSDFIRNMQSWEICINIVTGEKPIIFKDVQIPEYTYVIRPLVK